MSRFVLINTLHSEVTMKNFPSQHGPWVSEVERPPGPVRVMAGIRLGLWEDGSAPGTQAAGDSAVSVYQPLFPASAIARKASGLFSLC